MALKLRKRVDNGPASFRQRYSYPFCSNINLVFWFLVSSNAIVEYPFSD